MVTGDLFVITKFLILLHESICGEL